MYWKKCISLLTLGALTLGVMLGVIPLAPAPDAAAAPAPFSDMEDMWWRYRDAVAALHERGIIGGYPDGTFKPKQTINRAELLKIIFKDVHDLVPIENPCFSDIDVAQWYAPYVCVAKRRGIVSGYPDGTFKPAQPVNFAEALKILMNAYGTDVREGTGAAWYAPYVRKLNDQKVMTSASYLPWEPLNRERAADLLLRVLQYTEERTLPALSAGCGRAAPETTPSKVTAGGLQRDFLLTVPASYVEHDPLPLLVAFHGRTSTNAEVREYYGFDRAAPQMLIAYPAALVNGGGTFSWSVPGDTPNRLRDIAFFDALVEQLARDYCIDLDRIFVAGHSLGSWFANSLACVRGDVVRASAGVGGDSVITDCAGPTAAFIAHNPHDTLAPFSGAETMRTMRVAENFCTDAIASSEPRDLNCMLHTDCSDGNPVLWCPHQKDLDPRGNYYPHNWPSGTAEAMLQFFENL